ncbi:DUF4157 domain-containing protein [Streptomyces cyaneofuscatus]|uniref:DUF4157 domain-containing protein n=1 Tax=Streptomyces cyaneofuscatus TaxID=66883 RepID=UPI00379417D8
MDAYDQNEREQQDHGSHEREHHEYEHHEHADRGRHEGEHLAPGRDGHDERGYSAQPHHLFRAAATGRADVVGTAGMGMLQRTVGNSALGPLVQRARAAASASGASEQAAAEEAAGEQQRSPVHDVVSSGGGAPLDTDTRADMESRMGADFSDVRVHHDSAAHESAKGVGAHAYTVGNNVVFQRDAYDPSSPQGRTTLAHELTHVIQQRNGPVEGTEAPGGIRVSDPSDRFEREAVANADRVLSDPAPAAPAVQRTATEDEDEQPADVQGSFVQRAEEKNPAEEGEEEAVPE